MVDALATAYVIGDTRNRGLESYVADSGKSIYAGALVGLGLAADTGYLIPWVDAGTTSGTNAFLGVAVITEYDTDKDVEDFVVVGDGTLEVPVNTEGFIIDKLDLSAGSTITIANVGEVLYCQTDNIADIQLARIGAANKSDPIGTLVHFRAGEICDVRLFTPNEAVQFRGTDNP
tara:strand:- start:23 stop:547 length:525 start_codon:yes stop_codon:yes gene_type:complete